MKSLILLTSIFLSGACMAQQAKTKSNTPLEEGYEMKKYYFVMLTKGLKRDQIRDTAVLNAIQKGHLDNINRLAEIGKIVIAGPFADKGNWRGLFIFDCETQKEVEDLLKTDPAIAAGRLAYEIHPWYTAKNCLFR